jgi:spore germination cell wall hydrolase CwlJ-like protein
MLLFDAADVQAMALCIWKEARGEGNVGMQAVAWVIRNRAADWYPGNPDPVHLVVFGKNQFTSMSVPSDPEFNLQPPEGDPQYAYCAGICPDILNNLMSDVTSGAHYYANLKYATSGWFAENISGPDGNGTPQHPRTATIGNQCYYK